MVHMFDCLVNLTSHCTDSLGQHLSYGWLVLLLIQSGARFSNETSSILHLLFLSCILAPPPIPPSGSVEKGSPKKARRRDQALFSNGERRWAQETAKDLLTRHTICPHAFNKEHLLVLPCIIYIFPWGNTVLNIVVHCYCSISNMGHAVYCHIGTQDSSLCFPVWSLRLWALP